MAIIFDGYQTAAQVEVELTTQVKQLNSQGIYPGIAAVLFAEDQGSVLYTQLKQEAASRVGIKYQVRLFSLRDPISQVLDHLQQLNQDTAVTGIIIQKPWRQTWLDVTGALTADFAIWWQTLTQAIQPNKDVDGLHPSTLAAIKQGTWQAQGKVLPATCQAVLEILKVALNVPVLNGSALVAKKIIILGKSDLLGQPLFYLLKNWGSEVELMGSSELTQRINQGLSLTDADIIISATGRYHLIKGEMIKTGAIVIDVGEPQPDVDFLAVSQKASFITPVPGGVGPMTIVSLLKNCLVL